MDLSHQAAHPTDAKREVLKEQALSLRITRASYRQIARALGISLATAHELVMEALEETRAENTEQAAELRRIEVALLDEMTLKLWPKPATPGAPAKLEPRTADTILRISERRAKLLGLDAPQRWEGSGPGGGPIPLAAGILDVSALSLPELRQLEAMYAAAGVPMRTALPSQIEAPETPGATNGTKP